MVFLIHFTNIQGIVPVINNDNGPILLLVL